MDDPGDQKQAKQKAETMLVGVGYPEHVARLFQLDIQAPMTLWAMRNARAWPNTSTSWPKLGTPPDRKEWWMTRKP